MSENSKIEWTDHTFNPWIGCTKVGPGCNHCYAENLMDKRMGVAAWGPGNERVRTKPANWQMPLRWNAKADAFMAQHGRRQRVFCASLADVFDNAVDPQWRADLFDLIAKTPNLDWLLLTKRIGNVVGMLAELVHGHDHDLTLLDMMPLRNVWIGATVTSREEMLRDGPKLRAIPARVRFWSVEPQLGDLGQVPKELFPEWVIVGGESGPGARPMQPSWARNIRDQCRQAGVPFLFKQWGEWAPYDRGANDGAMLDEPFSLDNPIQKLGKKFAGRLLDGRTHDGFPT